MFNPKHNSHLDVRFGKQTIGSHHPVVAFRYGPSSEPRTALDRDRDCLLVFFVGVASFRVAAAVYFLTDLLVAAAPVVMLASGVTIASPTSNASRRVVGQWGGAGGASCENHLAFCGEL